MSALPSSTDNTSAPSVRALKQLIERELEKRPSFIPVSFRVIVPRTMALSSGDFGYYRFATRSGQIPNSPGWVKGMEYLVKYSGYVIIRGADTSEVVIDIDRAATPGRRKTE